MSGTNHQSEAIRQFILDHVSAHPKDIVSLTVKQFGISRQAVNKHIRNLTETEKIEFSGTTKDRVYSLKSTEWQKTYTLDGKLSEDRIWRQDILPHLKDLPKNVVDIWRYGVTEMINNAIDHSEGTEVTVHLIANPITRQIFIVDNGVGIFRKIQSALNLEDERHAVLELAKGKLTTDSKRHSGEGIFFTSRAVDSYAIISGSVRFFHAANDAEDYIFENTYFGDDERKGTAVLMSLSNFATRTMQSVYDEFTTENDGGFGFDKTVVPVRLAQHGDEMLVSRSQAKRLLSRVDRFRVVLLDFEDVHEIGQAFADEVFRVFKNAHPEIVLLTQNVNNQIQKMINRAGQVGQ